MEEDHRDFANFVATTHRIATSVQAAGWPPRARRPSYALLEEAYTVWCQISLGREREVFIDNTPVRIHLIIEMILADRIFAMRV